MSTYLITNDSFVQSMVEYSSSGTSSPEPSSKLFPSSAMAPSQPPLGPRSSLTGLLPPSSLRSLSLLISYSLISATETGLNCCVVQAVPSSVPFYKVPDYSPQGEIRNSRQDTVIPQLHQTFHGTLKPARGIRPPDPIPHRTRIHRRIPEALLPREKRRLRVRGRPADTRAHNKDMRSLRNPENEIPNLEHRELALPDLLGTPKGIAALSEFITFTFTGE